MLKRIIHKIVSRDVVQHFPSDSFDSSKEGFIVISSPEDIVELIDTPGYINDQLLKKIINTAISRLGKSCDSTAKS